MQGLLQSGKCRIGKKLRVVIVVPEGGKVGVGESAQELRRCHQEHDALRPFDDDLLVVVCL